MRALDARLKVGELGNGAAAQHADRKELTVLVHALGKMAYASISTTKCGLRQRGYDDQGRSRQNLAKHLAVSASDASGMVHIRDVHDRPHHVFEASTGLVEGLGDNPQCTFGLLVGIALVMRRLGAGASDVNVTVHAHGGANNQTPRQTGCWSVCFCVSWVSFIHGFFDCRPLLQQSRQLALDIRVFAFEGLDLLGRGLCVIRWLAAQGVDFRQPGFCFLYARQAFFLLSRSAALLVFSLAVGARSGR